MAADVEDDEEVGVVERAGRPRLLLEAPQQLRVGAEGAGEELDRHLAHEPGVSASVDLPHPSGSQRSQELVGTETGSRSESHLTP